MEKKTFPEQLCWDRYWHKAKSAVRNKMHQNLTNSFSSTTHVQNASTVSQAQLMYRMHPLDYKYIPFIWDKGVCNGDQLLTTYQTVNRKPNKQDTHKQTCFNRRSLLNLYPSSTFIVPLLQSISAASIVMSGSYTWPSFNLHDMDKKYKWIYFNSQSVCIYPRWWLDACTHVLNEKWYNQRFVNNGKPSVQHQMYHKGLAQWEHFTKKKLIFTLLTNTVHNKL